MTLKGWVQAEKNSSYDTKKKENDTYIKNKKSQTFYISSNIVKISFISMLKCFINEMR